MQSGFFAFRKKNVKSVRAGYFLQNLCASKGSQAGFVTFKMCLLKRSVKPCFAASPPPPFHKSRWQWWREEGVMYLSLCFCTIGLMYNRLKFKWQFVYFRLWDVSCKRWNLSSGHTLCCVIVLFQLVTMDHQSILAF